MQFTITTITTITLFALGALAAPAPGPYAAIEAANLKPRSQLTTRDFTDALDKITGLQAGGCSVVKCATALAPTVVGCAAAAAEEFVNPIADAACIAAGANVIANNPAQCEGCNPLDDE